MPRTRWGNWSRFSSDKRSGGCHPDQVWIKRPYQFHQGSVIKLFDMGIDRGSAVVIAGSRQEGTLWSLTLRKK